jgi:hypothetical protein
VAADDPTRHLRTFVDFGPFFAAMLTAVCPPRPIPGLPLRPSLENRDTRPGVVVSALALEFTVSRERR